MSADNFLEQQAQNRRRSQWLVAGFVLFFAWVGFGGDLALGLLTADAPPGAYHHVIPVIGVVTSAIAFGICWSAQRHGARRVLWSTGAWEIINPGTAEQRLFANVVEEMAIASGLPRPRLWVVPDDDPNAFATGNDPAAAHIAVTSGLLARLDRNELQAVVAHEMAHIRNEDTRLMTLLAGMIGAVLLVSDGAGRLLGHGGGRAAGGLSRRGGGRGGAGPLGVIVLVVWLVSLLVAPLVTRILAMAVSRKREFLADATAVQLTRNPVALASALEKLEGELGATHAVSRGTAHLCIVDPGERSLSDLEGLAGDLFASHPPIRERIGRIRAMAGAGG